jgi:purine-cytosine permease-like protein
MPFAGYFAGSVLMYFLGLLIGLAGGGDVFTFIGGSRFRFAACAVVVLSTVTTAFLDLYSAAVSSERIVAGKNRRLPILAIGLFAVGVSTFFPVERYGDFLTAFLTAIGMVFVPVYSLLFMDFLTKKNGASGGFHWPNLAIAAAGMIGYWVFSRQDPWFPLWIPTLMSMALVSALYLLTTLIKRRFLKNAEF